MTESGKLYELRMKLNLTLQQAADIIGINKSTLCRYEQSFPRRMKPEVMEKICRLYQVTPEYFEGPAAEELPWAPMLTAEEAGQAYRGLDERTRMRISRIIIQESKLSYGKP